MHCHRSLVDYFQDSNICLLFGTYRTFEIYPWIIPEIVLHVNYLLDYSRDSVIRKLLGDYSEKILL